MTWTAGTSLIDDLDELRTLLGPHVFENLEANAPANFALMDLVTKASDEVRASIKGVNPSRITNESDYKPAVAAHVHALLCMQGFINPPEGVERPVNPFEWSKPRLTEVEPRVSSGDRPPHLGSSVPRARNINSSYF